jgi:hypothetical protein
MRLSLESSAMTFLLTIPIDPFTEKLREHFEVYGDLVEVVSSNP